MVDSMVPYTNTTQASASSSDFVPRLLLALLVVTLLCFSFFLYFIIAILKVYFTSPHIRDHARYILFAHMLLNDTLYLIVALILLLSRVFFIYFPVSICYAMLTLAASTFRVTPYNLAAMALERYVAICYPLRHMALCTPQRSNTAIALMWVTGIMPNVVDLITLSTSAETKFFSLRILCRQENTNVNPLQSTIQALTFVMTLTLVGLIIFFTYVKVMLVAQQINTGSSFAFKAGKTVMLHAFQLLLCMTSLTSSITETYSKDYIALLATINFLFFMCLPRFLSPLIYGLRDEVFSKCIRKMYSSRLSNKLW